MRRQARTDSNQADLIEYMRMLGATWQPTHTVPGALDGILGIYGIDQRVEIKDGDKFPSKRKLTELESKTFNEWKGRKPVVVETRDDVRNLLAKMREEAGASVWEKIHSRGEQ